MQTRIDFKSLTAPKTPNWCLAAPDGLCQKAQPQFAPPIYAVSVERLWDKLLAVVQAEPRITIHDQDKRALYVDFTQTSFLFRFPDRVTVQILPAAKPDHATLAIFSRSKYGRSDLGVNAKRVKRLLEALGKE